MAPYGGQTAVSTEGCWVENPRMPGHASSLRKHDRKADSEWKRTREFPLAGTKSLLFKFEIKKGKDKGQRKRHQNENGGRSAAGLQ